MNRRTYMKPILKPWCFATALLIALGAHAQDTVRLSLDSCLRYAYQHNLTIQNTQLNKDLAQITLDQARLSFTPAVNASASETFGFGNETTADGNYGVNANWTLFNGMSRVKTYQRSKLGVEQSLLQIKQSENNIAAQIIQAYLTVLMNEELLKHQQEVLVTSEEQQKEGEAKYKVGRLLESDYKLLVANYVSAVSEIENTRLTIQTNLTDLKNLMCMDPTLSLQVERHSDTLHSDAYTLETLDSVMARAQRNLPDLQIDHLNVTMAQHDVAIARASYLPTLGMNAGTSYYGGRTNTVDANGTLITAGGLNTNIGLSLNIPIWSQGQVKKQVAQSKINLQQAQIQEQQTALDLSKQITDQYNSTTQSLNTFRASEQLADAYKDSYDVYLAKFKAGTVTTVELLQQQNQYLNALNTFLQNKYSFIMASKILDIYMGNDISL